ncbi:MAG: cysteine desulfurase [Myxococcales bacterium]|nr:cysteine desulfurase [Myxococcales bacterium]
MPLYLDHHATTPLDPRVLEAMLPFFGERFGNAGSAHLHGRDVKRAVEEARDAVAALVGGSARELIFTSGATESDNLALAGVMRWRRAREGRDHLVVTEIEHDAVRLPAERLAREGFRVSTLPVDARGYVSPEALAEVCDEKTALVSVCFTQSEVGAIQDLDALGAIARAKGAWLHSDAAQGVGYAPLDARAMPVDLLSLSAHKMYGPKGVGALWVRRDGPRVRLEPLLEGGGQENGLRSGTTNVPGVVGFGAAAALMSAEGADEARRLRALRDALHAELSTLEGVHLHGPPLDHPRHPGNLNLGFDGVEGEGLLLALMPAVSLSSGSACASAKPGPSRTLLALGVPRDRASASLRFGLGRETSDRDVAQVAAAVRDALCRLRARSPRRPEAG